MRPPKHIRDLADAGRTFAELTAFRRQLEAYRITVVWSDRGREWILSKIPAAADCERGAPTIMLLRVGVLALAALMDNARRVAQEFEERIAAAIADLDAADEWLDRFGAAARRAEMRARRNAARR